jgi:hypothetical protein
MEQRMGLALAHAPNLPTFRYRYFDVYPDCDKTLFQCTRAVLPQVRKIVQRALGRLDVGQDASVAG